MTHLARPRRHVSYMNLHHYIGGDVGRTLDLSDHLEAETIINVISKQYRLIYLSEVFASEPKDTIDYKSGRRRVFVGHVMQFNGMLL